MAEDELTAVVTDKDGNAKTLDSNASNPGDRPRGMQFSTQQGSGFYTGGFNLSCALDDERDDIHLLDDVRFVTSDGSVVYEGFVAAMPRSTDTDGQGTLTVTLAGYMATASGDPFRMVFVDRDLSSYVGEMTNPRRAALLAAGYLPQGSGTVITDSTGRPGVVQQFDHLANTVGPNNIAILEAWYDAGPGSSIASVYVDLTSYDKGAAGAALGGSWVLSRTLSADDAGSSVEGGALGGTYSGYYTATSTGRRYMFFELYYNAALAFDGLWSASWRNPAVYGNHGLTLIGSADPKGVAASDVIRWVAANHCPLLNTDGVQDTTYPIGHLAFKDRTTPYDAMLKVNSYHLWDLAVWEDRTLTYQPVDLTDWDWEIRHDEVGNQIGLQGDEYTALRNGIVVQFTSVETGQMTELLPADYPDLRDDSVDNPFNAHGWTWTGEPFVVPYPTTLQSALQLGRIRLLEDNQPKAPGSFTLTNKVRDRAGNWQPVNQMRSGQRLRITSSASLSERPRLIHETSFNQDGRVVTVGVDSTLRVLDAYVDRVTTALGAAGFS